MNDILYNSRITNLLALLLRRKVNLNPFLKERLACKCA